LKSANLAICFLGFAIERGEGSFRRSADLGMLASIFDLVSDGLCYKLAAYEQFERVARTTLAPEVAGLLFKLMQKKKNGDLELRGLERGAKALEIIIKHLRVESAWPRSSDIIDAGVILQLVDDILDYRVDLRSQHLN